MTFDSRWKNPQGADPKQLHLWAQDLIKELRKGAYLAGVSEADGIGYDNTTSGLTADTVQEAIDETEGRVDVLEAATVIIASGTITNQATLDIPLDGDTWDEVEIFLQALAPVTDGVVMQALLGQSGSFLTGASDYAWRVIRSNGDGTIDAAGDQDSADSEMQLTGVAVVGNAAGETASFTLSIPNPRVASLRKVVRWDGHYWNTSTAIRGLSGSGELIANTAVVDDLRILFASGNIATGFYKAIGRKYT